MIQGSSFRSATNEQIVILPRVARTVNMCYSSGSCARLRIPAAGGLPWTNHDSTFSRDLWRSRWSARLPCARPRQPDRRAYRLQSRLRPARGAPNGHLRRRRAAADGKLRIYSEHAARCASSTPPRSAPPSRATTGPTTPIGVAQELVRAGSPLAPANLLIRSTVPEGAGLSSSAALEVSSALAMLDGRAIDPAGPGPSVPAGRAQFRGYALRHHGPVHLRLRPRSTPPSKSIAAAWATATCDPARGRRLRGRQHHGEARAGRLGLQGPRARMRRRRGGHPAASFRRWKACATSRRSSSSRRRTCWTPWWRGAPATW